MKTGVVIAVSALVLVCACTITAMVLSRTAAAKRKAPPTIKPIIIGTVEYRAPNTIESEGIVEAWSVTGPKLLWKRKIYPTLKLPSLLMETDVQLNFVTN